MLLIATTKVSWLFSSLHIAPVCVDAVDNFRLSIEHTADMLAEEPVGNLRASSSIRRQRLFAYACMYAYNICLVCFYCCSQSPKPAANFDAVALLS